MSYGVIDAVLGWPEQAEEHYYSMKARSLLIGIGFFGVSDSNCELGKLQKAMYREEKTEYRVSTSCSYLQFNHLFVANEPKATLSGLSTAKTPVLSRPRSFEPFTIYHQEL